MVYNDIFGNLISPFKNVTGGSGNLFENPLINSITGEISMVISPAVDSASNIPGITDIKNCEPDMGFKEFPDCLFAPFTPSITSIQALNCCEILIVWNDLPNESSYTLFRNIENNTNTAKKIAGLKYNTTSYIDRNLEPEKKYYYWLKAYNRKGFSGFSDYKFDITKSKYYPLQFKVFPTYYNPTRDGLAKIFFSDFTEDFEIWWIKIYDIAGNIIKTFNEKITGKKFIEWDGRDENGIEVKPGIYIIHIKGFDTKLGIQFEEKVKMVIVK